MWTTFPPPSIMTLAWWMGVIFTSPAEVSNSCAGRLGWPSATAATSNNPANIFIDCDFIAEPILVRLPGYGFAPDPYITRKRTDQYQRRGAKIAEIAENIRRLYSSPGGFASKNAGKTSYPASASLRLGVELLIYVRIRDLLAHARNAMKAELL